MPAWDDYLQALKVLNSAEEAGRAKLAKAQERAEAGTRGADERLRTAVADRQRLDKRLGQVDGLCNKVLTEMRVPRDGPIEGASPESPRTVAEALSTVDQIEERLRAAVQDLERARRMVPPPPPPPAHPAEQPAGRTWVYAGAGLGIFGLLIVILLIGVL